MERATASLFKALLSGEMLQNCVLLKQEVSKKVGGRASRAGLFSSYSGVSRNHSGCFHVTQLCTNAITEIQSRHKNNGFNFLTSGNLAEAGEEG